MTERRGVEATVPPGERPGDRPGNGSDRARLGRAGFETSSDVYERARPGYPADAVASIVASCGIAEGARVLEVAAGTGKLTRQLLATGADLVAVEPSASMREVFRSELPAVPVAAGTAETIPLADASVDAVVVAQAFHWFDAPAALREFARVLRPGGALALVWNERDETDPVMAALSAISRWDRCMPYAVGTDFGVAIDGSGLFGPVTRTTFRFVQTVDRPTLVDQVASRSYVQVLADDARRRLLDEVAAFAATLDEPIDLPYVTDLFVARAAR